MRAGPTYDYDSLGGGSGAFLPHHWVEMNVRAGPMYSSSGSQINRSSI